MSSLDFFEMYFNKMFISAIRSPMKTTAKIVKVIITEEEGMSLMAAHVEILQ